MKGLRIKPHGAHMGLLLCQQKPIITLVIAMSIGSSILSISHIHCFLSLYFICFFLQ